MLMISVIISSVSPAMLAQVSLNIADTIGVAYELIAIDNSAGAIGICQVYNQGAARAKHPVLCFVHEDVAFKTYGWGQTVVNLFANDDELGLLGVAGSSYKTAAPSGWHGAGVATDYANLLQDYKHSANQLQHYYRNPKNEKLSQVACVDGVWLCTTRTIAQAIRFDEQTFTGFHAYDIDFSLAVGRQYKVAVTYDVLLHHFSEGNYDKQWISEILKLHGKWHRRLPLQTEMLTPDEQLKAERETFFHFIAQAVKANIPMRLVYLALWQCHTYRYQWRSLFFKLNKQIYRIYKTNRKANHHSGLIPKGETAK